MDLTVNLPDSRGNLSFVWPLHEPYTQTFVENSIISDLKTKCRPFEQVGPHAKSAMADWIYGTQTGFMALKVQSYLSRPATH